MRRIKLSYSLSSTVKKKRQKTSSTVRSNVELNIWREKVYSRTGETLRAETRLKRTIHDEKSSIYILLNKPRNSYTVYLLKRTDKTCFSLTIQTHSHELYWARRRTFQELNSLTLVRLMKTLTFGPSFRCLWFWTVQDTTQPEELLAGFTGLESSGSGTGLTSPAAPWDFCTKINTLHLCSSQYLTFTFSITHLIPLHLPPPPHFP